MCVCEGERERVCVSEGGREGVCVCEGGREGVCVCEGEREGVCVCEGGRERVCVCEGGREEDTHSALQHDWLLEALLADGACVTALHHLLLGGCGSIGLRQIVKTLYMYMYIYIYVASVPGLPQSMRVSIMRRQKTVCLIRIIKVRNVGGLEPRLYMYIQTCVPSQVHVVFLGKYYSKQNSL